MAANLAERIGNGTAFGGLHAGTLGPGVHVGYDFSRDIAVRGFYNHFNLDFDKEKAGNEYEGEMKLRSFGLVGDWHPFWGAFRISGGVILNNNRLSASTEGVDLGIGLGEYDAELDLHMDFERFAPYLGIGWTTGRDRGGLSFTADIGAILRSAPRVSATGRAEGCDFSVSAGGDATVDCAGVGSVFAGELSGNLEREQRELRDALDKVKVYPVISLGVSYRF
jgi:hypothetical protein